MHAASKGASLLLVMALAGCQTTNDASNQSTETNIATSKPSSDQHFITSECGNAPPGAVGLIGTPLGLGGWFVATGVAHIVDHQACSKENAGKPRTESDKGKMS